MEPVKRGRGRPRKPDGERVRDKSPAERGYPSVILPRDVDALEKIDTYMKERGLDSRGAAVVDAVERASTGIPWEAIRDALVEQFGYANRDKVNAAIKAVQEARE